jgi:antitoxin CptB
VATVPTSDSGSMANVSPHESETELEVRRLRWQCRRGMLELDHLLDRFLDLGYPELSQSRRLVFVRLLAEQDQRLSDWFMSRSDPPDPELRELVRHIVEVVRERRGPADPGSNPAS